MRLNRLKDVENPCEGLDKICKALYNIGVKGKINLLHYIGLSLRNRAYSVPGLTGIIFRPKVFNKIH